MVILHYLLIMLALVVLGGILCFFFRVIGDGARFLGGALMGSIYKNPFIFGCIIAVLMGVVMESLGFAMGTLFTMFILGQLLDSKHSSIKLGARCVGGLYVVAFTISCISSVGTLGGAAMLCVTVGFIWQAVLMLEEGELNHE